MKKTRPVYYLRRFNPADSFVVGKPFRLNGVGLRSGDPFDRALASTRTMRQLYEQRRLVVADPEDPPATAPAEIVKPEVRHVGHGKFRVFRGGSAVTEAKTRAEADADLAALAS